MELWKIILIAIGVVFLINFILKKVAFLIRLILIIIIVLVLYYFLRDPVVALFIR